VRRDLATGLSLATLWFIGVWSDLLPFLYISDRYPIGALPCWNDFAAVVANVMLLGGAFAAAARVARRGPPWLRTLAGWTLLAALAVPANAIRNHFNTPPERLYAWLGPAAGAAVFGAVALALLAVSIRWHARVVRGVIAALTIMFPLVLVTFAQAGWAVAQAGGRMRCGGATGRAARMPGEAARRVLWIVYDEIGYRPAFDARPAELALPAFDALRAQALSASAAHPPGDRTERSMPAFLTGLRVTDSRLVGRNQLLLTVDGRADARSWTGGDTVFAAARGLGLNTGLVGFFLPYCAMIGDSLTTCDWQPCVTCGRLTGVFGNSVGESMWYQASELAPRYGRRRHLAAFRALQRAGVDLAADPAIGMAVVHLPAPHEPGIYDRARGELTSRSIPGDGYVHNLALADRSLGELRRAMESSRVWDRTTVMVFGDHGRRSAGGAIADPRVPFLVKLAGESRSVAYDQPLDLLRVHALTIALLEGRLTTTDQLVAWLGHPD
jgi:hypothetical protein